MHTTPLLLLIRPEAQSKRLIRACEAALGGPVPAVISPIMEISPVPAHYDPAGAAGIIVTSANAVRMAQGLAGRRVYCVGQRTAEAARAAGAQVAWVAPDSATLIARLTQEGKPPLLWLRGRHAAGDVARQLTARGLTTEEAVIYDQQARTPDPALLAALEGEPPAILPLYSPRSATLIGAHVETPGPGLHVIAISPAVADAWHQATGGNSEVCDRPEGQEMFARLIARLRHGGA